MKYIAQPDGRYAEFDEASDAYAAIQALPAESKPAFLSATNAGVKAYFVAQAEATQKAIEQGQTK